MDYDLLQWISFFYTYSFLGWCIESTIVSIEKHKLINRGFLRIPMLPLYGSGAVILLIIIMPFKHNILCVYVLGLISATVLEYTVGTAMENIFKMKYWDYSNDVLNYKGRICLVSSLFWGFLCVVLVEVVNDYVYNLINLISVGSLQIIVIIISLIFMVDVIISVRNAIDLPKILEKISDLKMQIENVYEEIDLLLENASKEFEVYTNKKELDLFVYNTKEKLLELKEKIEQLKEGRKKELSNIDMGKLRLINNNPTSSSMKFNDSLKEIRDKIHNNYEEHVNKIVRKLSLFQSKIEKIIHGNKEER